MAEAGWADVDLQDPPPPPPRREKGLLFIHGNIWSGCVSDRRGEEADVTTRVVREENAQTCDPGPLLGAFQPFKSYRFVSDYVHAQLQG